MAATPHFSSRIECGQWHGGAMKSSMRWMATIAALTAGACGGSGKPAAEPAVSHSEPAEPPGCGGEDCCEAIYEKETKCGEGRNNAPEEAFLHACRAAAKAEETKEDVVAAGDCAAKS